MAEKPVEQKGDSPKPSLLATFFRVGHTRPMKGMSAPACSTVPELLDKTADKMKVTPREPAVTEPNPRKTYSSYEGYVRPCVFNSTGVFR